MSAPRSQGRPRRTIGELRTLYRLEPSVFDIYVEGTSDKALLSWLLRSLGIDGVFVYTIDTVDVPANLVIGRGLELGEKGETIALGMELGDLLGGCPLPNVVCLVDNDLDLLLGTVESGGECVLRYDFSSIEMYAFTPKTIGKFFSLGVQAEDLDIVGITDTLRGALVDLTLVRAGFHKSGSGVPMLANFPRCCTVVGTEIVVDIEELVTRSLNASDRRPRPSVADIMDQISELRGRLPPDSRAVIGGHDFIRLFTWFLREGMRFREFHEDVVEKSLRLCLEPADMLAHPTFKEIVRRIERHKAR